MSTSTIIGSLPCLAGRKTQGQVLNRAFRLRCLSPYSTSSHQTARTGLHARPALYACLAQERGQVLQSCIDVPPASALCTSDCPSDRAGVDTYIRRNRLPCGGTETYATAMAARLLPYASANACACKTSPLSRYSSLPFVQQI